MPDASDDAGRFSSLFTSGAVLFVGLVANMALGLLTRIVVAKALGKVDYGAIALGYTLLTVVSMVALLGTDSGVGRYLPRFDDLDSRKGVLRSAFNLVVPLSLVGAGLLFVFAEPLASRVFDDPALAPVIAVFALGVPIAAVVKLTVGSARGMQDSLPRVYIRNLGYPIARLLLVVLVIVIGVKTVTAPVAVAWAYVGGYVIAAALAAWYLVRKTPLLEPGETDHMHVELLTFSAPLMITATMAVAFHQLDTILLGMLATTGDVGVYNVVYPLARLHTALLTSFAFLFMPIFSELHASEAFDEMARTFQVVSKWIFFATLPLFLVFVTIPGPVIGATFGGEYTGGGLALAVLAIGFFTHVVAGPGGNALIAIGHNRTIMLVNTTVVAVNLALNLVLIPRFDVLGAAVATTAGYGLMNALYLGQLYRTTGIHPFTRSLVRPGGVALVLWVGLVGGASLLTGSLPVIAGAIGVFTLAYPLVVVGFGGVDAEDIRLVDAFENRAGVDLDGLRNAARRLAD